MGRAKAGAGGQDRAVVDVDDPGGKATVDTVVSADGRPAEMDAAVRPVALDDAVRARLSAPGNDATAPHGVDDRLAFDDRDEHPGHLGMASVAVDQVGARVLRARPPL